MLPVQTGAALYKTAYRDITGVGQKNICRKNACLQSFSPRPAFTIGSNFEVCNKSLKFKKMARTNTYLNFPRNTEEAFNFYKSIFGGEFTGGIARFSDVPPQEGMPPMAEADKNLVMHIELPIVGGHVLMATDAPESMGFKVNFGNNMHIS